MARVYAHNIVVAPHPSVLQMIKENGIPVDTVLELAARRSIEVLERKVGAKIFAIAGVHLEDSSSVRPHLHIRMAAYDSKGRYIGLFDRKKGSRGGNRMCLQEEIERQIIRQISRRERFDRQYE